MRVEAVVTVAAPALLVAALAGCTSDADPASSTRTTEELTLAEATYGRLLPRDRYAVERSSTSPDAPTSFRGRSRLPSCGYVVQSFSPRQEPDPRVHACFRRAALPSSAGAEMVSVSWTVEGQPVIAYRRVGPGTRGLETFIDASRDTYGAARWVSLHEDLGRVARIGPPRPALRAQTQS